MRPPLAEAAMGMNACMGNCPIQVFCISRERFWLPLNTKPSKVNRSQLLQPSNQWLDQWEEDKMVARNISHNSNAMAVRCAAAAREEEEEGGLGSWEGPLLVTHHKTITFPIGTRSGNA